MCKIRIHMSCIDAICANDLELLEKQFNFFNRQMLHIYDSETLVNPSLIPPVDNAVKRIHQVCSS